jgi:hypothetical protein
MLILEPINLPFSRVSPPAIVMIDCQDVVSKKTSTSPPLAVEILMCSKYLLELVFGSDLIRAFLTSSTLIHRHDRRFLQH